MFYNNGLGIVTIEEINKYGNDLAKIEDIGDESGCF